MGNDAIVRVKRVAEDGRDFRGRFTVLIDGRRVGHVLTGGFLDTVVSAGPHTVQVMALLEGSGEWGVTLQAGETVTFVCKFALGLPIEVGHGYYIDLHPDDA